LGLSLGLGLGLLHLPTLGKRRLCHRAAAPRPAGGGLPAPPCPPNDPEPCLLVRNHSAGGAAMWLDGADVVLARR